MFKRERKIISLALLLFILVGIVFPSISFGEREELNITILGTTDMHANIFNWSYEDGTEKDDLGIAKVYSVVEEIRKENPNTLLIDNGDTIQGTILSDDLYNTKKELPHPVIDVMNFMKYDAMTLGNHEFNFGIDMVKKIEKEAEFPILAANVKYNKDDSYFVKPYAIAEVAGIKVGILGLTNPNIPRWDGPKVTELKFENMADAAEKHIKELKEKSDIIIATAHAGFEEEYGKDGAKEIIERCPEIAALLVGHSHATVKEKFKDTVVGGARDAGRQVVRFDLSLKKDKDNWVLADNKVGIIDVKDYKASEELKEYAKEYHKKTLDFLVDIIGVAAADFIPTSEIKGIPEAQIRDTAVIDLINEVQLKATGADIAAAALFQPNSNIKAGDITYASIFDIYKYPNTLIGIEINGKELKDYMEWSAKYYNTFKPGDINISFNPDIRGYNYDMFQGVEYKVDISKPEGQRIVDLKFKDKPVKDTDKFKLAINNYRYGGLKNMGIISGEPYFESDPKSLRSYIADYIREKGEIAPETDNNWEIIGADFNDPYNEYTIGEPKLREYIINEINKGNIVIPSSEDGRTYNVKSINTQDLIKEGLIPKEFIANKPAAEVKPEQKIEEKPKTIQESVKETKPEVKLVSTEKQNKYVVKPGDVLWKIGRAFGKTWKELAEFNNLKNPHLIYPGQIIYIPQ
ncbi:5'-nucleotidase C-terminal domain-containing protein [Tissierella sp.]|uniref:5'-nucleotidase C-terminal domain-containing protein n=1 Tax=Tissierella sp. TaxID=41274 RepID=UPI0028B23E7E|nr:5'-nucleotidase C-terminal domain-containing protein [Tissierella sp.]